MPYQPQVGGYKYREIIARGRSATRKQRQLIADIVERGPSQAELFQMLTAVTLLTSTIDDVLEDLSSYEKEGSNQ